MMEVHISVMLDVQKYYCYDRANWHYYYDDDGAERRNNFNCDQF